MEVVKARTSIKQLLDLCDRLHCLQQQLRENRREEETLEALKLESRRTLEDIQRDLQAENLEGFLGEWQRRYRLDSRHWIILLTLLQSRLGHGEMGLKGKALLNLLFDKSYEILSGISLLDEHSILRRAGLISAPECGGEPGEVLESTYRLSDMALRRIVREVSTSHQEMPLAQECGGSKGYRNNLELIMDYRALTNLYQRRARILFGGPLEDNHDGPLSKESIEKKFHMLRNQMRQRSSETEGLENFPVIKLQQQYNLSADELCILVFLFFQETFEGNSCVEAVELFRLVSHSEEELLTKRRLLSPRSNLVRHDLVVLEDMIHDKETTAEVSLPNWVGDRIMGSDNLEIKSINADTRLDFHFFLEKMNSSEEFYENLEKGDGAMP